MLEALSAIIIIIEGLVPLLDWLKTTNTHTGEQTQTNTQTLTIVIYYAYSILTNRTLKIGLQNQK